ncbi:MAG: glycosyltransferase family 4 protein [Acidobacteria bacterium]|nr:glycosyltransferase family 4 protein [Acidobacteriota bacterium]
MKNKQDNSEFSPEPGFHTLRLAYLVSHPIQYQAPMLKRIAQEPDIHLTVLFCSDISLREHLETGFGVNVKWDVPLLEGYQYEFLPHFRDNGRFQFFSTLNHGIYKRLRRGRFDAVWVHGYATFSALHGILAARLLGIPVLVRNESNLFDRQRSPVKRVSKRIFFRILESSINAVLSIGAANTAYWQRYFGKRIPICPFYYSVDNQFFRTRCREAHQNREQFRNNLGLQPDRPIILFASKLQARKRCGDLLEAFLKFYATQTDGRRPYLLIVGDGEKRAELEQRAKAANLDDVRFLGFQNQTVLPAFYDLCDVFVLPSVDEPWGLVINEVMNAGKPVIVSTEVGCQRDLVEDGVNGFVVEPGDIDSLATALRRSIADPSASHQMGLKSLEKIEAYSFEQNVAGLRKALQAVVPGFESCQSVDIAIDCESDWTEQT